MHDFDVDTPVYPVEYGTTEFPHTTPRAWHVLTRPRRKNHECCRYKAVGVDPNKQVIRM